MTRCFSLVAAFCACVLAALPPSASAAPRKGGRPRPPAPAAEASPATTAREAAAGSAHLRIWKASENKESATLQIRWLPSSAEGAGGKGIDLLAGAERYQFTGYGDVPAGAGSIEISSASHLLASVGVNLTRDQNCTLLVRAQGNVATAELIDDTLLASSGAPAFSVYNLMFGGKGEVQVNLGDALTAHLSASGGTLRAQGVKAAFYQITVSGTDGDGQSLRWNTETDLRKVHRATLIICPDAYGRIRPRLIEDGAPTDAPSADKANG